MFIIHLDKYLQVSMSKNLNLGMLETKNIFVYASIQTLRTIIFCCQRTFVLVKSRAPVV